ncbi:O-antigen ligase family protein [Pseudidiomarina sp. 1ASP75-14]|uniref:O-antigen ligase family protein n=1 Tax=Pseudidiomarina terrestris TaxID=2820060 RepID=UPI00264B8638|nr:O-antigen ligase family protein [Pseudidiomarina sp. 1ASP75-14]MDN7136810.1 O-antigen ligase family protein [Pseudidiomarina sp. 1ASP75-14]
MKLQLSAEQFGKLALVLLVYPVIWLDTLYGMFSFLGLDALRVSLLYRTAVLLLGLIIVYTRSGILSWLVQLMILAWAAILVINSYPVGDIRFIAEFTQLTRWLYPFTVVILTLAALERYGAHDQLLLRGVAYYGWVFGVFMLFSYVTGLGIPSYEAGVFGIKSFYVGGNDIGLAALISLSIMFVLLHQEFTWWRLSKIVLCCAGLLLLGTKAGWAGAVLLVVIFTFLFRRARWIILPLLVVAGIAGANWLQTNHESLAYQLTQVQALLKGANPRERLIQAAEGQLEHYPDKAQLTGGSYSFYTGSGRDYYVTHNNTTGTETYKAIEQEWYDLRGGYGVPFAVYVFLSHLLLLVLTAALMVRRPTVEHLGLLIASGLYIGHGIFAGHAFVSGQPSGLIAVLYAVVIYRLELGALRVECRSKGD